MATNETLNSFIDKFNEDHEVFAGIKPLSDDIDYVEFVDESDFNKENFAKGLHIYRAFLIKKDKKYVGIIQDTYNDLHIYLKEEYRKKTSLIESLNDVVIPFILRKRDKIEVSFINEKVEEYFLKNLKGIKSIGYSIAEIIRADKVRLDIPEDKDRMSKLVKIDAEVYKIKNLFREFINKAPNKKAVKYLVGEDFISESEYNFLTADEKKNYSLEEFLKDRELLNPILKKKNFCCSLTNFYAGEEAEKKLKKFIKEL